MTTTPEFASIGTSTGTIDVRLSYKIVELFSEGLYTSPNKAIEELVANSFDAGARRVHVMLSPQLHDQDATIVVIDDGEGMDADGLKQHWLIGISNKRRLTRTPRGRQQIGKFGIGKLATYVLADRLTHVSKCDGEFFSTSMDYTAIDRRLDQEIEPKSPIKIPLRRLSENEAKKAVAAWTATAAFREAGLVLFGKGAPASWTVAVMSSLKPKVHEIRPGVLEWILKTALPLRDDFAIHLNGKGLESPKALRGRIKRWIIGKDITALPKPGPKDAEAAENTDVPPDAPNRFGLQVPGLGRVTGYAEVFKDLLTGKSDEISRSHGFFVYVFGRLINVTDGHFGIPPDELRHGTFGQLRIVVHMDGLDDDLRSNRETMQEGPRIETARNLLRAIFNEVRPTLEEHDASETSGERLARKLAASPASLARQPVVEMARAAMEGRTTAQYTLVPTGVSKTERESVLSELQGRVSPDHKFVTDVRISFEGTSEQGIAAYDIRTGVLRINGLHPFVGAFLEDFASARTGQPLELLSMAEVLLEAHLFHLGVSQEHRVAVLDARDQLLRHLAQESGRRSALTIASALQNARNNPDTLEIELVAAFNSLGFEAHRIGKSGKADGYAAAHLSADGSGTPRRYAVSLEAKSKKEDKGKVSAKTVGISTIIRQRGELGCDHAVVVGRDFPTSEGDRCALAKEIDDDRAKTQKLGTPKTITLVTIDDLARLVRLRPIKQLGLQRLRGLFHTCRLPDESRKWVDAIAKMAVTRPPYRTVINAIHELQKEFKQSAVGYGELRENLRHQSPPVKYESNDELINLCRGMAQMAPGAITAGPTSVELDQSPENVVKAIEAATKDYPIDDL